MRDTEASVPNMAAMVMARMKAYSVVVAAWDRVAWYTISISGYPVGVLRTSEMLETLKREVSRKRKASVPLMRTVWKMTFGMDLAELDVSSLRWIAPSNPIVCQRPQGCAIWGIELLTNDAPHAR